MATFDQLVNQRFRFTRIDGSCIAEMVVLLENWLIAGYRNDNEFSWAIYDGKLVLKNIHGDVTTRFDIEETVDNKITFKGPFVANGPDPHHVLTILNDFRPISTGPHEVVIARWREDISWITRLPGNFKVTVYDKSGGSVPMSAMARERSDRVIERPNQGRESETFLEHIRRKDYLCPDGYTVFLQGLPFDGAPEFMETLQAIDRWAPLQPLSWKPLWGMPDDLLEIRREQVSKLPVPFSFAEPYSLRDLGPLQYFRGIHAEFSKMYRADHYLPEDAPVGRHFLKLAGVDWIDLDASDWGAFTWAAQFGVKTSQLAIMKPQAVANLIAYAKGHKLYGYLIEQCWLHLCGLPLLRDETEIPNLSVLAPV